MSYTIEVCTEEGSSTTEKGKLLEELAAHVLRVQQYEITKTLRVTGMEIDVLAKHKINNSHILVECKAWESTLPADAISKLLGNIELRKATAGWLFSTGPLSSDAKGIQNEWEERTDSERSKLSFYTSDRIIELLIDAHIIVFPVLIKEQLKNLFASSENSTLMVTTMGMFWLIPIMDKESVFTTSVIIFNARTGERINNKDVLEGLKSLKNSYSSYQWLEGVEVDKKISEQLLNEYHNIVPVISGDDWTDYRPARPEDFVGRKLLLADIFNYFTDVIEEKSSTRLFAIKAPSGMGKSSVVLKIASMAQSRRKSKQLFIYAVDVRTAMSSRYVEMALKACFEKADSDGFTDTKNRNIQFTNIASFMQSDSIVNTLSYLKSQNKMIVLIFDQFEELLSKKEYYDLFNNFRILSNILDALKQNFILGFAWKIDLTVPAEHHAYYMWSNLSDRRKEFEVVQFKHLEIKNAIKIFGNQLGEKINPVLGNYLSKQCQGYPWLLKKLCIHVFNLLKEGTTQETAIGRRLNIIDLFEKDIAELSPEEYACIKNIARESPADYFKIVDIYKNNVITSLINRRIIIRRASILTLYWDIFRDYILNKTIPTIILDYIPQHQFSTIAKVLSTLLKNGNMSSSELSKKTDLSMATIDNIMIDVVMLGVARREDGIISLSISTEEQIVKSLQSFFTSHVLYNKLQIEARDSFSYDFFSKLFNVIYEHSDINIKTKQTYCAKMLNWFVCLGLVHDKKGLFYLGTDKEDVIVLGNTTRRYRNKYGGTSNSVLFFGQAPPEKMIETYKKIANGMNSYKILKSQGLRNAIELLSVTNGISKKDDVLFVTKTLDDIFKTIETSATIEFAVNEITKNPYLKGNELGDMIDIQFSRGWAQASIQRYGNALLIWAKYLFKGFIE
jgi:Holliday junction resolvase-like predicted endonuclease